MGALFGGGPKLPPPPPPPPPPPNPPTEAAAAAGAQAQAERAAIAAAAGAGFSQTILTTPQGTTGNPQQSRAGLIGSGSTTS